jgi:hypothetical protein
LAEFDLRPKQASAKSKPSFQQKPSLRKPLGTSRSDDLKPDTNKCISSFEPSNIFNIQNSSLWRLRNLGTWFKEQESYEDSRYIKSYSIKI